MKSGLFLAVVAAAIVGVISVPGAMAEDGTTPLTEEISLKETTVSMSIPSDNKLVWGYVRGEASEFVQDYPVIIQFFQDGEAVHVAQVDAKGDGSFEYQFRVRNTDHTTGQTLEIFQGDYTVKIFRVVPNHNGQA